MKDKSKNQPLLWMKIFLIIFVSFFCFETKVKATADFAGEGTSENPYLLYDANDLLRFAELVNEEEKECYGQYFVLANDIDLSDIEFVPIGLFGSGHYFFGIFDGNGYAIRNISINNPDSNNGLFGVLGGTVVNLVIDEGEISGACCGVISSHAANSQAQIMNCVVKKVTVNAIRAGGVVDNFAGSVINCISDNCILNGEDSFGAISSYAIGCDSHGNYYSILNNNKKHIGEVIVDGSEQISFVNSDIEKIISKLNSNYRYHDKYAIPYLGICNLWEANDNGEITLTKTKQKSVFLSNISNLSGSGSKDDPYIIKNVNELSIFRDAVNSGYDFYGEYVQQNANIDLSNEVWTPIGQFGSGKYFFGTYDGKGHTITNISTITEGNNGFFGELGGTVANLGIESGLIQGDCCGAIASHAATNTAMIINCYNKADVVANRAGGIADNFLGSIIGCWSNCNLKGNLTGGISSYDVQNMQLCKTSFDKLVPTETMTGRIVDSEEKVSFIGAEVKDVYEELYFQISKVKKLSGLKIDLYPVHLDDGQLFFSEKPYTFDFKVWINDNTNVFICAVIFILLLLFLLLKVGPKTFYVDNRKWWKRFILIFAPVFLFFYIILIHSPIEFFIVNNSEFDFILGDFAYKYIILSIICSVIISALIALPKGKICDILACAVLGIDLDIYCQLNFMNGSLGLLDGTTKTINTTSNYINIAIWIVLFFLPFILFFVMKKYRRRVIVCVCGALCFMQITSIITLIMQSPDSIFERKSSKYFLTANNQFTVSADDNIIILIMDAYSNAYIDECFETYPEVKSIIKDFTYYNNTDCHYEGSVYSINYITTGTEWDPSVTINRWCVTAWDNEKTNTFYSRLKEKGYIFNLYSGELSNLSSDAQSDAIGKINNLIKVECNYQINDEIMFNLFMDASMYRIVPLILKEHYEFVASNYKSAYTVIGRNDKNADLNLKLENADFYKELMTKGLKTDDCNKYYILQHLHGVHGPYTVNENCESVSESTLLETERGCWKYIAEYLDQLKKLGVYDNATIIITADHGKHHDYYDAQPIFFIKNAHEEHDRFIETNAPISFIDIMPTVLYISGSEYADFGTTIYEHAENEKRERTLYIRMYDDKLPEVPKRDSPTNSILNCFYKFVYIGDINDLREVGGIGPTEKIQWTDSFY